MISCTTRVLVGVLLSALFFARKVGELLYVSSTLAEDQQHSHYQVVGQVFFTSAEQFVNSFDFKEAIDRVTIDLHRAHFWDITAITALDKVAIKFRREGTEVEVIGLNEPDGSTRSNLSESIGFDAQESLLMELVELDIQRAKLALEQGKLMLAAAQERVAASGIKPVEVRQRHNVW